MTQEEFKTILDMKDYSYYEEDGWVVINRDGIVFLDNIKYIPEKVKFNNIGDDNWINSTQLHSLESIPKNVRFYEGVSVSSLKTVHYDSLINNKHLFTYGKNIYFKNGKEICRTNAEVIFD